MFARRAEVVGGTVYVAFACDKGDFSQSRLFALDLETGAEKWSYTVEHSASEPVTDGSGVTYWSSFEGNVHALDPGGALIWKAPGTRSNIFTPCLLGDDRLVIPEIAGGARNTWCLERATGKVAWRFEHGGHAYPVHCHGDRVIHSSVVSGGFDKPPRGSLFCLAAADGDTRSSTATASTASESGIISKPTSVVAPQPRLEKWLRSRASVASSSASRPLKVAAPAFSVTPQ